MLSKSLLYLAALVLILAALASNAEGERGGRRRRDSRVHDASPSDAEHHDGLDDDEDEDDDDEDRRSRRRRRDDGHHDSKYDHESFLGREDSDRFDRMSAEESQKKLAELIPKIDKNNDSKISEPEMQAWLSDVARKEIVKQAENRFLNVKENASAKDINSSLSFDEWKKAMHHEIVGDEPADKEIEESFNSQIARDLVRWEKADANGDKLLNLEEFADFLHIEQSPRMKDVVVTEAMNVTDLNRDGKIDLTEYMRELRPDYEREKREGKKLPKWVVKEEEHFKTKLDLNKDGTLDPSEVYKWVVPEDIDHSKRETKHLFDAADENKDKFLSKDEVMKNWEIFVGHQVTHFGEFAPINHEEL